MSTPIIIQVPSDTTPTQWNEIHKALSDHRVAHNGPGAVDVVTNFPQPALSPWPTTPPPAEAPAAAPSLLDSLTAPQPPVVVAPVETPVVYPEGEENWLAQYVGANNALPTATDENWPHILADKAVHEGTKGTAHEAAVTKLRKQAGGFKARYAKAAKNGGTQPAAPATQAMTGLAGLLGQPPATQPVAQATPAAPVVVAIASDLNEAQLTKIRAYRGNLVDSQKQLMLDAWLQGDMNPATGKPLSLADLEGTGDSRAQDVVAKIRSKVKV